MPKFNLTNTRRRIQKTWAQFRAVRNRDIRYMRKHHPKALLDICDSEEVAFRIAVDGIPMAESKTKRPELQSGEDSERSESMTMAGRLPLQGPVKSFDPITIGESYSDSISESDQVLELQPLLSTGDSRSPPYTTKVERQIQPSQGPSLEWTKGKNMEPSSSVNETAITKSWHEFRRKFNKYVSEDEVPIGLWKLDPDPKRIITAGIGERGIIYTIRNWTREMNQIEPGDGYKTKANVPARETNWPLVAGKVDFLPVLLNNSDTISSQDKFTSWLFTELSASQGFKSQAWINARDMRENPWLNLIYQRTRSDTLRAQNLLTYRSHNMGVGVACYVCRNCLGRLIRNCPPLVLIMPLSHRDYTVACICPMGVELAPVKALLDEIHPRLPTQRDQNSYVLGKMGEHNVVVAVLPEIGNNAAATVAIQLLNDFPAVRFGLLVGIGGGVPDEEEDDDDIRLGDVVVSKPLAPLGEWCNTTWANIRAVVALSGPYLSDMMESHPAMEEEYSHPGLQHDHLFQGDYAHPGGRNCQNCDRQRVVEREPRRNLRPKIHYGTIGSANTVVKDAALREELRRTLKLKCVEMEAAGMMDSFPCIVIRGVCDYADSHKNKRWQPYAAATAAAYMKELLAVIPGQKVTEIPHATEVTKISYEIRDTLNAQLEATKAQIQQSQTQYQSEKHYRCHQTFKVGSYEAQKNINPDRVAGTCQWVLTHPQYLRWLENARDDLLWISADPGCGKSVLAKSLIGNELRHTDQHTVCYFFFKDNEEQSNVATALCALLHQLFSRQPHLIQHATPVWEKNGDILVKEVGELWRLLLATTRDDQAYSVTCVLDALDECQPADRQWLIEMLSHFHTQTSAPSSSTRRGQLKFLVTSRPYDDIRADFQRTLNDLPTIHLRGEEENDQIHREIDLVIRMRVEKLAADLELDIHTKDQLETRLLEMEHRTYLWLYLAIQGIYETYRNSLRPAEASIESLPLSVEDAYDKILNRISGQQKGIVKKVLLIVVGARRPLHVEEMAIALGIATSTQLTSLDQAKLDRSRLEKNIRYWCGLFVFINHHRIYLIHQTAKEFLVGEIDGSAVPFGWKNCLDAREIEREMTRTCVAFLAFDSVEATALSFISQFQEYQTPDEVLEKDNTVQSFLVYSAEHWPSHLREAYIPQDDSVVVRILELYQVNGRLFNIWFPIFWQATARYNNLPEMSPIRLGGLLGTAVQP
ncbi:hypothetical protein CLAIMM_14092 [Cladophialophora immunda]|nr:hypothetical protein CLAIMM_14092 [Cladophialophora immunda]